MIVFVHQKAALLLIAYFREYKMKIRVERSIFVRIFGASLRSLRGILSTNMDLISEMVILL